MTRLEVQTSALGRHTLVTLWGEVDVTNSDGLTERLNDLLGRARGTAVIVHLAELGWCDTTGLSSFIAVARTADRLGVPFLMAGARGRVARILQLTGLDRSPWIRGELAEAVRAVQN